MTESGFRTLDFALEIWPSTKVFGWTAVLKSLTCQEMQTGATSMPPSCKTWFLLVYRLPWSRRATHKKLLLDNWPHCQNMKYIHCVEREANSWIAGQDACVKHDLLFDNQVENWPDFLFAFAAEMDFPRRIEKCNLRDGTVRQWIGHLGDRYASVTNKTLPRLWKFKCSEL